MKRRSVLRVLGQWSIAALLASLGSSVTVSEGFAEGDWEDEFLAVALPIITNARAVRVFKLTEKVYGSGPDLTLERFNPLPPSVELSTSQKDFLISKLSDPASYNFKGRKAMRFYADYGLIFEGSGIRNVLLISTSFEGARLVLEKPLSSQFAIVNLELIFPELMSVLEPALNKGG